jgi:hypothetical protein
MQAVWADLSSDQSFITSIRTTTSGGSSSAVGAQDAHQASPSHLAAATSGIELEMGTSLNSSSITGSHSPTGRSPQFGSALGNHTTEFSLDLINEAASEGDMHPPLQATVSSNAALGGGPASALPDGRYGDEEKVEELAGSHGSVFWRVWDQVGWRLNACVRL